MVDGRGLTSAFTYDGLNRLTEAQYNTSNKQGYNETRTAYTYDGGNRLTSAQDGQGTTTVIDTLSATYDGLNDLLTASYSSNTLNNTVTYTYDNDQNRLTMTAANQAQTGYGYDKDNHLTSESRGTQSVGIEYDSDGRYTTVTLPNGVTVNYNQYDADSHPTSITYSSTGGGALGNLTYGYDNDGRVNSLGGSLAAVNLPAAMPTATYDNGNQLATWNGTAATTDGNGNLLSDPSLNATYTWNERAELSSASAGGVVSSFIYDALGRRVAQTAGSLTTQYVYDMLNVAQEQFSTGGVGDMLPGMGLDQYFSRVNSSGTSTILPDLLGSTLGLVNSSGAIETGYAYGPFGQTSASGTNSLNPIQYTGHEMDSTGLYFLRARYYNPVAQRFISPDPMGLSSGQLNLYAYGFNSPTNFIDPLGLKGGSMNGDSPVPVPPPPPAPSPPPPQLLGLPSGGRIAVNTTQPSSLSIGVTSPVVHTQGGLTPDQFLEVTQAALLASIVGYQVGTLAAGGVAEALADAELIALTATGVASIAVLGGLAGAAVIGFGVFYLADHYYEAGGTGPVELKEDYAD